jgi:hypothetical protein
VVELEARAALRTLASSDGGSVKEKRMWQQPSANTAAGPVDPASSLTSLWTFDLAVDLTSYTYHAEPAFDYVSQVVFTLSLDRCSLALTRRRASPIRPWIH